jgi:hypothetical protein
MCKTKEICPLVSADSNDRERVKYGTALEALQAARRYNREFLKYSQVRYCPACKSWHITTKGTGNPGVSADLETGTVIIGEDFTRMNRNYTDLEALALRGTKLMEELEFVLKVKPLLGGINLKKCTSSDLIKVASSYIRGVPETTKKQIETYCEEKISYRIKKDLSEINDDLRALSVSKDRKEKGILIRKLGESTKRTYYISMIYPEFRGQLEAEIEKYK